MSTTAATDLTQYTLFRCLVGSRAYGLVLPGSDTDTRGVYLPPADLHWSLDGVAPQMVDEATDTRFTELERYLRLVLEANPTMLEWLYSPYFTQRTALGDELVALRDGFLTRQVYQSFRGASRNALGRAEAALRAERPVEWKEAMNGLRYLLTGETALRAGFLQLDMSDHRTELLAVRAGAMPWADLQAWRAELEAKLDAAFASTRLPDTPNRVAADAYLRRARRAAVTLWDVA